MEQFQPQIGLIGTAHWTVGTQHLAEALGNPGVRVLATPMLLDLMEVAAHNALIEVLPNDWVSLGMSATLQHLRPTPVGFHVWAQATVVGVDRQKVDFEVTVYDDQELVGLAQHSRFCLPRVELERRIAAKQAARR
ncbi:MAG: thioesterase [Sulfobacillus acidophilus]|uniref:Thioesterase n=1 Tax=Sulfobacillus acidophilus TaxID=53633 RepID=A0A2T2WF40_9FIRM|nr:MAG: thioesterase [Sulfobacillus acidophilus]